MVPTYVGVILQGMAWMLILLSGPHVCGGDPRPPLTRYTPCRVVPTYVGVILDWGYTKPYAVSGPHVCGGDSSYHTFSLWYNIDVKGAFAPYFLPFI